MPCGVDDGYTQKEGLGKPGHGSQESWEPSGIKQGRALEQVSVGPPQ